MSKKVCIKNEVDPRGREVFLYQYGERFRVEKPVNGFKSHFYNKENAEEIFREQCENTN